MSTGRWCGWGRESGWGPEAYIVYDNTGPAGVVYIKCAPEGDSYGSYSIRVTGEGQGPNDIYEPDDDMASARYINTAGNTEDHYLSPLDEDWFFFYAYSGYYYDIETFQPYGSVDEVDTVLTLYDEMGILIDSDDDSGFDAGYSYLFHYAYDDETVYMRVTGYDTGDYGIWVYEW